MASSQSRHVEEKQNRVISRLGIDRSPYVLPSSEPGAEEIYRFNENAKDFNENAKAARKLRRLMT